MNYETIKLTVAEGVATVLFNRPEKANALNEQAWQEMQHAFEALAAKMGRRAASFKD